MIAEPTIRMNRVWAMPSADTLTIPPFRQLVKHYLHTSKVSVDPFARNCTWATYTNDLNPDTAAEYHLEAAEFLRLLIDRGVQADLVIFDPPYTLEQCARSYQNVGRTVTMRDTQIFGRWTEHKELIGQLTAANGIAISFGFHSNGIGMKYGFDVTDVLLVTHGAAHYDTICTVERKRVDPQAALWDDHNRPPETQDSRLDGGISND